MATETLCVALSHGMVDLRAISYIVLVMLSFTYTPEGTSSICNSPQIKINDIDHSKSGIKASFLQL